MCIIPQLLKDTTGFKNGDGNLSTKIFSLYGQELLKISQITQAQIAVILGEDHLSPLSRIDYHTQTHHVRSDSSGSMISLTQKPLPDNTKYSDIHATGGV